MKNGFTHRVAFSSISNILWWLLAKTIHSFSTRELHPFLTLEIYRPYIYYIKVNFICRKSQLLLTECIKNDVLWQDFTVSCTKTICCHFKLCRKIKNPHFSKHWRKVLCQMPEGNFWIFLQTVNICDYIDFGFITTYIQLLRFITFVFQTKSYFSLKICYCFDTVVLRIRITN